MTQPGKLSSFTLGVFVATLFPIAALLGMLVCGIEQGARVPFEYAAVDAAIFVLGFLVTATVGHAAATGFLPAARSTLLAGRTWRFSVVCGIAVSLAAPLAETTEDVLGGFFGRRYGYVLLAGGAIFWSAMATAMVLGIDWLLCRLWRQRR